MCNNCIHKTVCSKFAATGGHVRECNHFREVTEKVYGTWCWITEDIYRCDNCGDMVHVKEVMGKPDWGWCPACGADMRGEEGGK